MERRSPQSAIPPPIEVRGQRLAFGERTFVMGILNVTPDSFSGDGLLAARPAAPGAAVEAAVAQARRMVEEGADLLDIGAQSTRPGHVPVGLDEERSRILEVVVAVRAALPDTPLSIDSGKTEVAEAALGAGADIVNDVTAITHGAMLAGVAASHGAPYILMHGRAQAIYADVVGEVIDDVAGALALARRAGCDPATLIVDPGIGFGKTPSHNLALLRDLGALRVLGRPILLGTSRKSTIGRVLGLPVEQRLEGTLATTALGIAQGADIVRVHDVAPNVRVARMSDAVVRGRWQDADEVAGRTGPR